MSILNWTQKNLSEICRMNYKSHHFLLLEKELDGKPPQTRGPVEKNTNRDHSSPFLHLAYLEHRQLSQKGINERCFIVFGHWSFLINCHKIMKLQKGTKNKNGLHVQQQFATNISMPT